MKIAVINGPNLNLQGLRQREVYGDDTFDNLMQRLRKQFVDTEFDYFQSNVEGELIDKIQRVGYDCDGIIINAGGYSHTSVAIHDALLAVSAPAVEVHRSNIFCREEYRHHSLISNACKGIICGLGMEGYELATRWLLSRAKTKR